MHQMKLKKCQYQMHFYDSDKYDSCPHCAKLQNAQRPSVNASNPTRKISDFDRESDFVPIMNETSPTTMKPVSDTLNGKPQPEPPVPESAGEMPQPIPITPVTQQPPAQQEPAPIEEHNILEQNIEVAPDESTKSKLSIFCMVLQSAALPAPLPVTGGEKTIAFYHTENTVDPVVGWLVCVQGPHIGMSFSLKAGQNFIGRALDMDIKLTNDQKVSRSFHAGVTFDPETNNFYAVPGHSTGLLHINGQLAVEAAKLSGHDIMTIGDSALMLIPLCGDSFQWSKYLK